MHRFADLPPELVAHIAHLSALSRDPEDPLERRRVHRHLHSLSRVHSTWTPIAQRLLLGDGPVQLYHHRQYAPFADLAVGPGSRRDGLARLVKRLDLELWGEEQDDELARVIRACEGIEEFVVTYIERMHFEQIACGPILKALSLRQCTLVSTYYPLLEPPADPPLSPPPSFASLTSLDLRLCSLRRDFLLFSPSNNSYRPLPNLQHLLLHTGSHDQSPRTVRALVRSVAPHLRSLSLDCTAEAILLSTDTAPIGFPALRTLGLYWDAAHMRLAGASLLLIGGTTPAYVHLALYPSALEALRAALLALLESAEMRAGMRWRAVEHFRAEGTLRDLDRVEAGADDGSSDEADAPEEHAESRLEALYAAAKAAGVDLLIETAAAADEPWAATQRATFARGFETSWWSFVREVEEERVQLAGDRL